MSDSRPNIVFIITDQQRYDTVGALGYDFVDTPAIDRLVREGTSFTQCHVAGASCVPSRGALFTGYYPHTTGILRNGDLWRRTWVERFAAAGYHTVNIGKMHTEPMDTPAGFDERFNVENKQRHRPVPGVNRDYLDEWDRALGGRGLHRPDHDDYEAMPEYANALGAYDWHLAPEMHPDVFTGDLALWWLGRKPRTAPLFLQIGFPGPHPPYDPTPDEVEPYLDRDLRIAPVSRADVESQPPPIENLRRLHMRLGPDAAVLRPDASMEDRHRQRAYYLANQTMIDRKIGAIVRALDAHGYLDDAVVVFTSDHGDCLGDHGLNQKWSCYEQITRVPLVVWGPRRVPAGRTVDALVQQQDVVTWLMEVAGMEVPGTFEVEPLSGALDIASNGAFEGRDAVYCEQAHDRFMSDAMMTMVRTAGHKLVHFLEGDYGQLFDLDADPLEEHNLWGEPGAAAVRRELLDRLTEWRMRSQLHASDWAAEAR